jgi:hypothetical protein
MSAISKNLYITYENPFSRNTGDSIYTANIIDALIDLECKVDIIYFNTNLIEPNLNDALVLKFGSVKMVDFKKKSPLVFVFSSKPGMIVNRESKLYLSELKKILDNNNYDNIFINHQKMLFVVPLLLDLNHQSKLIFNAHNAEYLLSRNNAVNSTSFLKKIVYCLDAYKTKKYEYKWLNKLNLITAISEHDENYFKENFSPKTDILRPVFTSLKNINNKTFNYKELIIAGTFGWGPKRENLISFLKATNFSKLEKNGFKLTIVGRADQDLVDYVNSSFKGVFMTGSVQEINPYYKNVFIAVIPEKLGGGFKLKVAEAALNKTAIFSIKGAITACNLIKNEHFLEFDTYENLIEGIINSKIKINYITSIIEKAFGIASTDFSREKMKASVNKIIH